MMVYEIEFFAYLPKYKYIFSLFRVKVRINSESDPDPDFFQLSRIWIHENVGSASLLIALIYKLVP